MSEETVVRLCAPTLAGIKTANLFSAEYTSRETLLAQIRELNRVLVPKGLRAAPLRYGKKRALVYVYRPKNLKKDLENQEACQILKEMGYECLGAENCLCQLVKRLDTQPEFPHEIGLFLGYPPEDVRGFMEHKAADSKCVGCWKVYGDVEAAQKIFRQYKRCTEDYWKRWRKGASLQRLIVAD